MKFWLVGLTALWMALQADLSLGSALGGALATSFVLFWLAGYLPKSSVATFRAKPLLSLAGIFLRDLMVANWLVLRECLRPSPAMSPAVLVVPVELQSDLLATTLASLVTLTPGTLSLEFLEGPRRLAVHGLFASERQEQELRDGIARYVKLLSEMDK